MTILQTTVQTIFKVDVWDFDNFIKEVYGHEFSLQADQEFHNDDLVEFILGREELSEYDQETLDIFKSTGRGTYLTYILLQDLVNNSMIDKGRYVISL